VRSSRFDRVSRQRIRVYSVAGNSRVPRLPRLIADAGEQASLRFLDFFHRQRGET
jgi:hypothetical protein